MNIPNQNTIGPDNSQPITNRLVVIIPCYNEEKRLQVDKYALIARQNPEITLLFVNDGSSDATLQILQKMSESIANISYLDIQHNCGKAEAVRQGFLHTLNQTQSQCIAFYDADMATPFNDLLAMVDMLVKSDLYMVTGCRFKRMGGNINRRYSRFLLGRIFATCAANVLCLPVYDTQCGAKVLKTSIIPDIFNEKFVSKWLFDIELFARIILRFGINTALEKIIEYPLSAWTEIGDSKLKFKDVIRQPYNLLKINNHYKIKNYAKQTCH